MCVVFSRIWKAMMVLKVSMLVSVVLFRIFDGRKMYVAQFCLWAFLDIQFAFLFKKVHVVGLRVSFFVIATVSWVAAKTVDDSLLRPVSFRMK